MLLYYYGNGFYLLADTDLFSRRYKQNFKRGTQTEAMPRQVKNG
jgi:hypothetical protein